MSGRPRVLTDEERRLRSNAYQRAHRQQQRDKQRAKSDYASNWGAAIPQGCHDPHTRVVPPDAVVKDLEYRKALELTLSQSLLGDPPPGYSALDRSKKDDGVGRSHPSLGSGVHRQVP